MQKRNNTPVWIISSLALLAGLVWLLWYFAPRDKYNWYESYHISDKEPYGGYVIGELLKNYHKGNEFNIMEKKPVHEVLDEKKLKGVSDYVFIGEALYLDSADVQTMLQFVNKGNDVFISSMEIPQNLTINLKEFQCYWKGYKFLYDTTANMNFYHPSFAVKKPYSYSFRR